MTAMRTPTYGRLGLALVFFIVSFHGATASAQGTASQGVADSPGRLEKLLAARPVVSQKLTIDQAVEIALKESPVVRGAQEEVQAAIGRVNVARAETRPWLSANGFASGGSESNIASSASATQPQMIMGLPRGAFADGNLMLMYPLYTGGRLSAMIRQAAPLRDASRSDFDTHRQDIALMTRMAYREAVARQSLVTVAESRLKDSQERLRIDLEKYNQGAIPLVTVRRDEAEVAAAQQEVTNARRDVELSLVQLKTVMGVSPASNLDLTGANDYQPSADLLKRLIATSPSTLPVAGQSPTLSPELAALLRVAERQRPELHASKERLKGAQAETSLARSGFQPQVNLFAMGDAMKSKGSDPFVGATFGVTASIPLYNGGQQRARIQTAEAERRKQEQEQNRIALQIAQEVSNAYLNLRAAEQNIQTARSAQTAAEEGYRVAVQRFEAGRSVQVEVLDALAARTQAANSVVQALFQYTVAQDQLLRAIGQLAVIPTTGSSGR